MEDPVKFAIWVYSWVGNKAFPEEKMVRVIQEYSYPGINRLVPCYFNSSTFRSEWLERRNRLLKAWK